MLNSRFLGLVLIVLPLGIWAQSPQPTPLPTVTRPQFLSPNDNIPSKMLTLPDIPKIVHGQPLTLDGSIDAPSVEAMRGFSDPGLIEDFKNAQKMESQMDRIYWHSQEKWDYCHYLDLEGNHWYGWNDGQSFQWILWLGKRYWWRDPIANHWLYYHMGYWWRAGSQKPGSLQVLVKGEYFSCDTTGRLLQDMGLDGNGLINSGKGRFRGDFHHGGGHGQGGGGQAGNDSNSSANSGTGN